MKKSKITLVSFLMFCCGFVCGENSSEGDVKILIERAKQMQKAFFDQDIDTLVDLTHTEVFGGALNDENLRILHKETFEEYESSGLKYTEQKLGTPTVEYLSEKYIIRFIPRISVISSGDSSIKIFSYLIGVKTKSSPDWKFIDGGSFREKPEMLHVLFPGLPKDISPPDNKLERIN